MRAYAASIGPPWIAVRNCSGSTPSARASAIVEARAPSSPMVQVLATSFSLVPAPGASTNPTPYWRASTAMRSVSFTPMVLDCTHSAPSPSAASAPEGPATAASTAPASASMVSRIPAPAAASAGEAATVAPRSASGAALAEVRFHARTSKPASRRLRPIAEPMIPVPSSAIVSRAGIAARLQRGERATVLLGVTRLAGLVDDGVADDALLVDDEGAADREAALLVENPVGPGHAPVRPEVAQQREPVALTLGERLERVGGVDRHRQGRGLLVVEAAEIVPELAQLSSADARERQWVEHQHDVLLLAVVRQPAPLAVLVLELEIGCFLADLDGHDVCGPLCSRRPLLVSAQRTARSEATACPAPASPIWTTVATPHKGYGSIVKRIRLIDHVIRQNGRKRD